MCTRHREVQSKAYRHPDSVAREPSADELRTVRVSSAPTTCSEPVFVWIRAAHAKQHIYGKKPRTRRVAATVNLNLFSLGILATNFAVARRARSIPFTVLNVAKIQISPNPRKMRQVVVISEYLRDRQPRETYFEIISVQLKRRCLQRVDKSSWAQKKSMLDASDINSTVLRAMLLIIIIAKV
ncbi:Hypothetical protein CINCED_3A003338 [Cinara cedri]|uniref:Uncharacterized protein n=1 Tax=Cinara cedri TaxID=506608 RepID=A0A5E4MYV3_9HEMI|nr:Hypothetical protein CINCED_3A003338 [Cinara cedri]